MANEFVFFSLGLVDGLATHVGQRFYFILLLFFQFGLWGWSSQPLWVGRTPLSFLKIFLNFLLF
jgi:hypothetical protein